MSQQDKPCTTHHHACDCREEKFHKLEAALKEAVEALEFADTFQHSNDGFASPSIELFHIRAKARYALERIKRVIG